MKTFVRLMMTALMALTLIACGGKAASGTGELATLGDALKVESNTTNYQFNDQYFVYLFEYNGNITRVYGKMTPELNEQLNAVFMEEDSNPKMAEILKDVKIERIDNLSENIPSADSLKGYIGKTGQDLIDEGYSFSGYYNTGSDSTFFAEKGDYVFHVIFEESPNIPEDVYEYNDIVAPLVIKSFEYSDISGSATDIDAIAG